MTEHLQRAGASISLSAIIGALVYIFGEWNVVLTVLVLLMLSDLVSGLARSYIQGKWSSDLSYKGATRKAALLLVVAVGALADLLVGQGVNVPIVTDIVGAFGENVIRDTIALYYCGTEFLSILENLTAAGVPVPDWLKRGLANVGKKVADPPPGGVA